MSHKHDKLNKDISEVGGQIVDEAEIKGEILLGVNSTSNMDTEWLISMKVSIKTFYKLHGGQILPQSEISIQHHRQIWLLQMKYYIHRWILGIPTVERLIMLLLVVKISKTGVHM